LSYDVYLISKHAPNGVGEYQWENADQVLAVPDHIALQLLRITNGGYEQVENYDARPVRNGKSVEAHNAAIALAALDEDPELIQSSLVSQLTDAPNPAEVANDRPPLAEALELTDNAPQKAPRARKAANARKAK
jgi:hypothetical protein